LEVSSVGSMLFLYPLLARLYIQCVW
jgi:hypothetical protein